MNISKEGQQITTRFFQALEQLRLLKVIRGVQTFTRDNSIERRQFLLVRSQPDKSVLKPEWIYYITKYGVNADWVITGRGEMLS